MTDTAARTRQPAGTRTGGQFATEPKHETGLALTGTDQPGALAQANRAALAQALDVDVEAVTMQTRPVPDHRVGPGGQEVALTAPHGDTSLELRYLSNAAGQTANVSARVQWATPELEDLYVTDSTVAPYDERRNADPDTITALVADVAEQARVQRALDAELNYPQLDALPAGRLPAEVVRVEAVVVQGRTYLKVLDGSRRHSRDVRLRMDGASVVGARVNTEYGDITVRDEADLEVVLRKVDAQLTWSLGQQPQGYGREHLESMFAKAFASLD